MRACELDGALGGDLPFEVLKCGGLHLVATGVVPVGGGADIFFFLKVKKKRRRRRRRCLVLFGI